MLRKDSPAGNRDLSRSQTFAVHVDCAAFVMGDPVELREVLVNVIYNAVDAMPGGGEIQLSAKEANDLVAISITDSGTGMRPEVKSRLFDPFFTTKGKAGTGMGLAVSFGIIRRHDGSIEVDSVPGQGTTFRILLPRAISRRRKFGGTFACVIGSGCKGRVRSGVDDELQS